MDKEKMFYELCSIMATLEDGINTIESIGLTIEPDEGIGHNLYNACSTACRLASNLLDFPDTGTEDTVCNELFGATKETVNEISKKIWSAYGIK